MAPRLQRDSITRVAIASRIFAPEPAAASFRLASVAASLAREFPVTVLTTSYPGEPRRSLLHGAQIRRFPVLRDRAGYVRGYANYLSFDIPLLFRLLRQPRGTVVLCEPPPTTGLVTLLACRLRGFRYVYFAADLWSEAVAEAVGPGAVSAAVGWMERRAVRGAADVLAVSTAVADRLAGLGVTARVVGNGIDTDVFRPGPGARPAPGPPLLVYTGTASEVHGALVLIEAMRLVVERHPGARFVFMGQGTEVEAMRAAARSLPAGCATFLPRQRPEVVADWLVRADIALASVGPGKYEFAFPTKVYAAAACGTPVVFAGRGEAADVIREGALGRIADFSAAAVADAVDEQLAETDWDGAAARQWVQANASLAAVGGRVRDVVRELAP